MLNVRATPKGVTVSSAWELLHIARNGKPQTTPTRFLAKCGKILANRYDSDVLLLSTAIDKKTSGEQTKLTLRASAG